MTFYRPSSGSGHSQAVSRSFGSAPEARFSPDPLRPPIPAGPPEIPRSAGENRISRYFYDLLASAIALFVRPTDHLVEVNPIGEQFAHRFTSYEAVELSRSDLASPQPEEAMWTAGYVLLDGTIHYERDIHSLLSGLHDRLAPETRLLFTYYSALWKPLLHLASWLGFRGKAPEENWIAHADLQNLCLLSGFEIVRREARVLCPLPIPFVSDFLNRYVAPLPFFRLFALVTVAVARPLKSPGGARPSVSVVVPARNEAGNIASLLTRCPVMGPEDELIFVEGNSTDDTWGEICELKERYRGPLRLVIAQQEGRGKGDAVRKGFSLARNEILMILDADLTVPPEELPKFYRALVEGKGEFINGSRLVYPMERRAMRFCNILGNKFFAAGFSFVLGQRFKDTLCGTKVLTRRAYERLAEARGYFGDFDPFGDFDLLFGAARLGLKIVDLPIRYRERTYGETNIDRWRHGAILLRMLIFAARRLKFLPRASFTPSAEERLPSPGHLPAPRAVG